MRFEWRGGLVWVSFKLAYEGSEHEIGNCILDTGSATTAIDIDLVDFNFQKHATITRLFGIGGGTQEVIAQKVDSVTMDGHEMRNIELEFGNICSDIGINGFLGNDILSLYTVTIDHSRKEIEFKL